MGTAKPPDYPLAARTAEEADRPFFQNRALDIFRPGARSESARGNAHDKDGDGSSQGMDKSTMITIEETAEEAPFMVISMVPPDTTPAMEAFVDEQIRRKQPEVYAAEYAEKWNKCLNPESRTSKTFRYEKKPSNHTQELH
jgi:hypothetical protein